MRQNYDDFYIGISIYQNHIVCKLLAFSIDKPKRQGKAFANHMFSTMTNHELVAQLYQKHAHALLKYLISSLRERQEVEDVLVEVFLVALEYEGLAHLNEHQQFAWLLSVARNKAVDWYRLKKRLPQASLNQMTPLLQEPISK
ncbi:RNA polymerase sigma factor [Ktedonospora formicarum]|uniref:RNA polymerase sigma-70 region 2 domain-containing protein n=1 Tax=Ktedonospora formicarum TaxID=2778364 RepID=A0A8J3I6S0_9CHLR|nr:hypothetical protein [Ktedonospora formicarum]GHO45729.1 hypothetical protein KSX_38920 [Ktedonospora formicarum]